MKNRLKVNLRLPKIAITSRALLNWLSYIGFFLFCFFLFAYLTFPYDRARAFFLTQFNQETLPGGRVKPSDVQLKIAELDPYWFTGAKLTGVELVKQATQPDDQPMVISADYVTVRPSILSLLVGDLDVFFDVGMGPGEINGNYKKEEDRQEILAGINAIDMSKLGIDGIIGLPVKGQANGAIDLSIAKEPKDTRGSVNFRITNLVIGDGKSKLKLPTLRDGLTVDTINAGNLQFKIKVDKGVGEIEKFSSSGKDIQVEGSGSIRFVSALKLSRVDLFIDLVFTDAYRNKSDRTRTLFSLLNLSPKLQRAKTNDGGLRYQITGTLGSPRYRPAGRSYRAPKARIPRLKR